MKQGQADLVAAKSRKYKSFRMGYGGGRTTTIMIPDEGMEIQCPLCQKRFLTLDGLDANPMWVCEQYEVNLSVGRMMKNRNRRIITRHYDLDDPTSA